MVLHFAVADREMYNALLLLIRYFTWERTPLGLGAENEASYAMDSVLDCATPGELQSVPKPCGVVFKEREPGALEQMLERVIL